MGDQRPMTKEQRRARRVVQQKERGPVPNKWIGSICFGTDRDAIWLRIVGVKLGPEKPGGWHDCEMTHPVFKKVERHWGTFFWELHPVYPAAPVPTGNAGTPACPGCGSAFPLGSRQGADDDMPGHCDTCWGKVHHGGPVPTGSGDPEGRDAK